MRNSNCYIILGVKSTASFIEIKSTYRFLAKKYHPDKNPENQSSEEHFKEIQYAYSILSDPEKRRKHDLQFSIYSANTKQKYGGQYKGNAYKYAQPQPRKPSPESDPFPPINPYKAEINYILISFIIALILLYFILSF